MFLFRRLGVVFIVSFSVTLLLLVVHSRFASFSRIGSNVADSSVVFTQVVSRRDPAVPQSQPQGILQPQPQAIPQSQAQPSQAQSQATQSPPQQHAEEAPTSQVPSTTTTYAQQLARVASADKSVLLTLVDEGFYAMALNFYLSSIKPHNVTNFLILTMHKNTCTHLTPHGINCFFYKDIGSTAKASQWGTQTFKDKMNVRTEMILDALRLDYTVLHTDIDMYFLSNPFDSISCARGSCDIAALMDTSAYNAGFLLINPSPATEKVYEYMQKLSKAHPGMDDQAQLNKAMPRQAAQPGGLKIIKLSVKKFLCGKTYFEDPKRYFADTMAPCPECVVVHNNWIVSQEAKVYRAKEVHQWLNDEGEYYSSTTRKYLSYENTLASGSKSQETEALQSALAISKILNRTLILPKFHCGKDLCPLNSLYKIAHFDRSFTYREHSFLTHPLVPESVKSSVSPVYFISSAFASEKLAADVANSSVVTHIKPNDSSKGLSEEEVSRHFGTIAQSVLRLHSAYKSFSSFSDPNLNKAWMDLCKKGFVPGGYRQYA